MMKLQPINDYSSFSKMFLEYLQEIGKYTEISFQNDLYLEWLDYFFTSSIHYGYYIEYKNQFVGFILACNTTFVTNDNRMFLAEFYIKEGFRHQKIGSFAVEQFFQLHKGKWELTIHPKNIISQKFWEKVLSKYGYTYVDGVKDVFSESDARGYLFVV